LTKDSNHFVIFGFMEMLRFVFLLGIVYIVFAILWFFLSSLPKFLTGAFKNNSVTSYIFKSLQYYLLAALTALQTVHFVSENGIGNSSIPFYIALGGLTLFLYLAGKTDKAIMSVQVQSAKGQIQLGGALKFEPHIVGISIIVYLLSFRIPTLVNNPFNLLLHKGILNFYDTFFIGFILSIIGFFFLFSMLSRGLTATGRLVEFMNHIVTGKPLSKRKPQKRNPFNNMGDFGNGENPFNLNKNLFNQPTETAQEEVEIDEDEYIDFEEVEEENKL